MKRFFASLSLLVLITALSARADDIEFGVTYPAYKSFSGTITLPEKAHVYVLSDAPTGFLLDGTDPESYSYISGGTEMCWLNVEPGSHLLSNDFPMGDWKVWYTLASQPQYPRLTEISPAAGHTLTSKPNYSGDIIAYFANPVTIDRAYFRTVSGTVSADLEITNHNLTTYWFKATPALVALYNSGAVSVKGGDEVTLVIEGLTSVADGSLFDDSGLMTITYVMAPKPIDMIDTNINESLLILSFYPQGDPRGIFTLTMSGTINTSNQYRPYMELTFGDMEKDTYCYEEIPAVVSTDPAHPDVENNMLSFDLTGKNRLPAWLAAGTEEEMVSMKIFVYDTTGQPAEGFGQGSAGSYNFALFPQFMDKMNVDFEFTPADGSLLADVDVIELWLSSTDFYTSFSGIAFKFDNGADILVPLADLVIVTDADGTVISCPVPVAARTEPVEVYMAGIVSTDGYTHDLRASYNKFALRFANFLFSGSEVPIAGEQFDNLPADPVHSGASAHGYVHIATTYDSKPEFSLVCDGIFDGALPLFDSPMTASRDADGSWWFAGPVDDTDFELNKEYVLRIRGEVNGATIGAQNIVFYSSQNAFAYSPLTAFEKVTPDNHSALSMDNPSFIVTFNSPVMINAKYSYIADDSRARTEYASYVCAHPAEAEENLGYDYEWIFTLPAEVLSPDRFLTCYVAAYDALGMVIPGDLGTKSKDALVFSFCGAPSALISAIAADDAGRYRVHALNGVLVLDTDSAADLSALAPGVYVVNGVKCLIRK